MNSSSSNSGSSDSGDDSSSSNGSRASNKPSVGINAGDNQSWIDLPNFGSKDSKEAFEKTPAGEVTDEANDLENIMAPAAGKVFAIRNYADISEYGNYVVIKHDDGEFSVFAHLEGAADGLQEEQRVEQGEVIATADDTGTTPDMGAHLHWAVFDDVDKLSDKEGHNGIFLGSNWVVNTDKTIEPQTLLDSGSYIHPSAGAITSPYGKRDPAPPRDFHEGMDYSIRRRRK